MFQIDYDTLERLLQLKGIPRRQLAFRIGIDEGQLASAFRRHSKMKSEIVRSIAAELEIDPIKLLAKDENGNLKNPGDIDKIRADEKIFDELRKDFSIGWIDDYLSKLNDDGLEEVLHFAEIISENPRFQKKRED